MADFSQDILVPITDAQVAKIQEILASGQYADGYRYVRDIVHAARVAYAGDGSPTLIATFGDAKAKALVSLESWWNDVPSINAGDGSAFSELVRGSTLNWTKILGNPKTTEEFQIASDKLALSVLTDVANARGVPSAKTIVGADVGAAVANLDLPEYAWAGQLADFLPAPLGFGNDFVKLPFDKGAAATAEAFVLSVASNAVGVVDVLKSFLSGNAEGINTTLNVLLQGFVKQPKADQVIDGGLLGFLPNYLVGGSGNDRISGGGGNDTLLGNDGNDFLDGGTGADKMYGGGNNDTYIVDNVNDQVIEYHGSGIDTVLSSVTYTLSENVENIALTDSKAINATGNTLNNILTGNGANNVLDGGAGSDALFGGAGNDILIGGLGNDALSGGIGNDLLKGGLGNDLYKFGRGDGIDTIIDSDMTVGNLDVLQFGADIIASSLWLQKVGNDLQASIVGTHDQVIIKDWYAGAANKVEQIKSGDGKTLLSSSVDSLVNAMASWVAPSSGSSVLTPANQSSLSITLAASWA